MNLNIQDNRRSVKWTTKEIIGRILWGLFFPLFRLSPRIFWGWRRGILRVFGAKIGHHVQIDPSARIFIPWNLEIGDYSSVGFDALLYNLGPLVVGARVTISHRSHLCGGTHDFRDLTLPLIKSPITIMDDSWLCADCYVGPNVIVGKASVVGARSVLTKFAEENSIYAGNPARKIGIRFI